MQVMLCSYENRGQTMRSTRWGEFTFDEKGFASLDNVSEESLAAFKALKWLIPSTVGPSEPAKVTPPPVQAAPESLPEPAPLPGLPPVTTTASNSETPSQGTPQKKRR